MTYFNASPQRVTLQVEGAAIAALALLAYGQTGFGWGAAALLALAPDLFMLGYLGGARRGAALYNLGHSYLMPLALWGAADLLGAPAAQAVALIWVAHIGVDRALGYGLKYRDGFKSTHLGRV